MKHKIIKLISIIVIAAFAPQDLAWARPQGSLGQTKGAAVSTAVGMVVPLSPSQNFLLRPLALEEQGTPNNAAMTEFHNFFGAAFNEVLEFLGLSSDAPIIEYNIEVDPLSYPRMIRIHTLHIPGKVFIFYTKTYVGTIAHLSDFEREAELIQIAYRLDAAPKVKRISRSEGPTLVSYQCKDAPVDTSILDIASLRAIAFALGKLHGAKICHNDLINREFGFKPNHIFVETEAGGSKKARFIDFGIAFKVTDALGRDLMEYEASDLMVELVGSLHGSDAGEANKAFREAYGQGLTIGRATSTLLEGAVIQDRADEETLTCI